MSQAVQLAKAAREKLASALNALQTDPTAPDGLMDVAEPIAQSMGVLHRIERSGGADLEGRDKALDAVRRALDLLQKIEVSHAAVDACLEAVAASLSKVHALTRLSAESATPAPSPVAAAAPPTHQQIPRPVASSPPQAAVAPQPASVPRPTPQAAAAPAPAPQPVPAPQPAPAPVPAPAPAPAPQPAPAPVPAPQPAPAAVAPTPAAWPPAVAVAPVPVAAPPAGSQGPSGTQVMGSPPAPAPAAAAFPTPASARPQGGTLMMQKSPVEAALAAQAIGVGFPPVGPAGGLASAPTAPAPPPGPFAPPHAAAAPAPQVAPAPQPVQAHQPQPVQAHAPQPVPAPAPQPVPVASPAPARAAAPAGSVVVELGAHSVSNFYKGLSGNDVIEAGGIFVGTYKVPKLGTQVQLRVLLPGDYEFHATAVVQWVREAGDGVEPGFGAKFTQITPEGRQLVYRYARNREPLFYDDL